METIKNLAGTAGTYIYGSSQSGTEPVSGETGKGTAAEPYDQGNQEGKAGGNTAGSAGGPTGDPTSTISSGDEPSLSTAGQPRPEHETDKTGVTDIHSNDPHGSDIKPTERSDAAAAHPSSAQAPQAKQQAADKPEAEPTGEEDAARSKKKDEGEEALTKRDPNDHSGEPLHMHDDSEEKVNEDKPGQEGGGEHGKEEGTGEQWVKSTGLAAEGGDFDATKPGAAKEANRLLEEKGVHKDDAGQPSGPIDSGTPDSSKKASKLGKIKDKLHIGGKH